jgi:hypothetical protein
MGLARQLFDLLLAGAIAGALTVAIAPFAPDSAPLFAVMVATMYYFSRYPWGAREGAKYNERIDAVYDRLLPF